jgi:hypothetical protein
MFFCFWFLFSHFITLYFLRRFLTFHTILINQQFTLLLENVNIVFIWSTYTFLQEFRYSFMLDLFLPLIYVICIDAVVSDSVDFLHNIDYVSAAENDHQVKDKPSEGLFI